MADLNGGFRRIAWVITGLCFLAVAPSVYRDSDRLVRYEATSLGWEPPAGAPALRLHTGLRLEIEELGAVVHDSHDVSPADIEKAIRTSREKRNLNRKGLEQPIGIRVSPDEVIPAVEHFLIRRVYEKRPVRALAVSFLIAVGVAVFLHGSIRIVGWNCAPLPEHPGPNGKTRTNLTGNFRRVAWAISGLSFLAVAPLAYLASDEKIGHEAESLGWEEEKPLKDGEPLPPDFLLPPWFRMGDAPLRFPELEAVVHAPRRGASNSEIEAAIRSCRNNSPREKPITASRSDLQLIPIPVMEHFDIHSRYEKRPFWAFGVSFLAGLSVGLVLQGAISILGWIAHGFRPEGE